MFKFSGLFLKLFWFISFFSGNCFANQTAPLSYEKIRYIFWAWQKDEDLSSLDPATMAIAQLAAHIYIGSESISVHLPQNRLRKPAGILIFPVLRIEWPKALKVINEEKVIRELETFIQSVLRRKSTRYLQLDFDVTFSQRAFYIRLLRQLQPIREQVKLSVTSLASWCFHDPWLPEKIADEIVPMLFDMGVDAKYILHLIDKDTLSHKNNCGPGIGLSTYEKYQKIPIARHYYFFSNKKWSKKLITEMLNLSIMRPR